MTIREQAPTPQRQEHKQQQDVAAIASHVAYVVDNLKRDRQTIPNSHELCRRSDMAMVAMLEVVAPVLPQVVQEQVNRLISIHDELYQATRPSVQQLPHEHEQGTSPRTGIQLR